VELDIANSIWAGAGRPFLPAFLDGARRWYDAQVTSMDLRGAVAAARINGWVSGATKGKIPQLLGGPLPDSTVMVLVNAVYFHGRWEGVFDSAQTQSHPFTRSDGSIASRRLMSKTDRFRYMRDSGFQALRLPYAGGRMAMYIFLPDSKSGLPAFAAQLDSAHWERWMRAFHDAGEVHVMVPKFRLEYERSLAGPLEALGMDAAFDRDRADFSRMLPVAYLHDHRVFVSDVLQKTFVDVSEQGTEAAAATGVIMALDSAYEPPVDFIVDRPFCLAIRDDATGLILFLGQITNPGAD
jgi:serine protease inhibitor